MVTLICPVRGCGKPLERRGPSLACPAGHAFDLARSGYCNLLQPQDRRSPRPGDAKAVVEARRRFLDAGYAEPLLQALLEETDALGLPAGAAVLDVGCGEGTCLGRIAGERAVEAHGTDLSAAAIDLAARRYPGVTWIVANADRFLPYAAGSFDVALSIDARLPAAELRRVLKPQGRLLAAVPGPDDLVELRAAVLGEGIVRDRMERAATALSAYFEMEGRRRIGHTVHLALETARDALAVTYRGGRASQRQRAAAIAAMDVTLSHDLARFRPR